MDFDRLEGPSCLCGKSFRQQSALTNHRRHCLETRNRVAGLLNNASTVWKDKNRGTKRQGTTSGASNSAVSKKRKLIAERRPSENAGEKSTNVTIQPTGSASRTPLTNPTEGVVDESDLNMSIAQRRPRRKLQLPGRFVDMAPHSLNSDFDHSDSEEDPEESSEGPSSTPTVTALPPRTLRTTPNAFGLRRVYKSFAARIDISHDPDAIQDHSDITPVDPKSPTLSCSTSQDISVAPYPNLSSFLLSEYYWNGGNQKSQKDFQSLVRLLTHPDFSVDELRNTSWDKIDQLLGASEEQEPSGHSGEAGWLKESVDIEVPFHSRLGVNPGPRHYSAGSFFRRNLLTVIQEKLQDPSSQQFHFHPYELHWKPPGQDQEQRVYGEMYTSPAFLEAHQELQNSPPEPGCDLPRVVIGLMFASDETHLTQFGNTKLWPIYMYFSNESKYRRAKPSEHLCHHVAYLLKLQDDFKDFVTAGVGANRLRDTLSAHCVREIFHKQWGLILDDDFIHAYVHGIVVTCYDGIRRRCYPRIFTYSADYKEKTTISGIRNMGLCPCPRCLVAKADIGELGTPDDRSCRTENRRIDNSDYRKLVAQAVKNLRKHNYSLDGKYVDDFLKKQSLSPTLNAFSERLAPLGFNFFSMFVVDQMHEIEAGNWKSLFMHLLRILHASDRSNAVHELDLRYRSVPTFRQDTIRKFQRNASEMKNLAARDWADLLQCSLPVFENLLDEPHNTCILDLLFLLSHWHGLAKLRLHTDATLTLLDQLTTDLGAQFRRFKADTCSKFKTCELPKETKSRQRKAASSDGPSATGGTSPIALESAVPSGAIAVAPAALEATASSNSGDVARADLQPAAPSAVKAAHAACSENQPAGLGTSDSGKKDMGTSGGSAVKEFSLLTYKFHAFGDYVETIRTFGSTDSYSTEPGELEHRTSKARYARTSKKNYIKQMTQIERRQHHIRQIRTTINHEHQNAHDKGEAPSRLQGSNASSIIDEETLVSAASSSLIPSTDFEKPGPLPNVRYVVGKSENEHVYLPDFVRDNLDDPAIGGFATALKDHLLPRIIDRLGFAGEECNKELPFFFDKDRLYLHRMLRLNYTTYDVRRDEDLVNPNSSHCNVMMLAGQDTNTDATRHPYLYARVLSIFHVNIACADTRLISKPLRFDVLWVRWYRHHHPSSPLRLDKLTFFHPTDECGFGFVDPANVLRACHVVPAAAYGKVWKDRRIEKGRSHIPSPPGISKLARDKDDWNAYYVNRFADRDMLMRFHWGMGIGHQYWSEFPDLSYSHSSSSGPSVLESVSDTGFTPPSHPPNSATTPTNSQPDDTDKVFGDIDEESAKKFPDDDDLAEEGDPVDGSMEEKASSEGDSSDDDDDDDDCDRDSDSYSTEDEEMQYMYSDRDIDE